MVEVDDRSMQREVLTYGAVQVASKLAPMVGVLIYARVMPLTDYGTLTIHFATIWLVGTALSLNLHAGIGRLLYRPDTDSKVFLGTVLISLGSLLAGLGVGWILLRNTFADLFGLPPEVIVLQTVIGAGLVAESAFTQIMIFQRRSTTLLRVITVRAVATLGLGLVLVLSRSTSLFLGVVHAEALISVAFIIGMIVVLFRSITLTYRHDYVVRLAKYSLPLIVYAVSTTLLSQSDRILIGNIVGVDEAGIYGLVYNLAAIVLLGTVPILNAFQPRFFEALNEQRTDAMQRDAELVFVPALILTASLVLWAVPIGQWMFGASFRDGFSILPLLAIGGMAQVFATIWNRVLAFDNRTGWISATIAVPVAVNLALNALLLPTFGYKVAAVTTAGSQLLMAILTCTFLFKLELPMPSMSRSIVTAVGTMVLLGLLATAAASVATPSAVSIIGRVAGSVAAIVVLRPLAVSALPQLTAMVPAKTSEVGR